MLPKIIIVAVIIFLGLFALRILAPKQYQATQPVQHAPQQENPQQTPDLGRGVNEPFYSKDGLYLSYSWPSEGNFSNEETEILLFNESSSSVEAKSFDLTYSVEGKTYPHKSGTWEKFLTKTSWDKIEYINISPQYYKGEPLILTPGQKGKLHWHINFGSQPLDGKQTIQVKLTLLKSNKTINIDEQFNRDSGIVFSKEDH